VNVLRISLKDLPRPSKKQQRSELYQSKGANTANAMNAIGDAGQNPNQTKHSGMMKVAMRNRQNLDCRGCRRSLSATA
jgi:hypothetical protein